MPSESEQLSATARHHFIRCELDDTTIRHILDALRTEDTRRNRVNNVDADLE